MKKPAYKKSQVQYAKDYDINVRTVRRHMEKGSPLDDPVAMEAVFASQKNRPPSKGPGVEVDATTLTNEQLENPRNEAEAKLYERILICRKLAHQVNESRRLIIPRDEVRAGQMRVMGGVKSRLLALPGEMPSRLVGKLEADINRMLYEWVYETLTTLSDANSKLYN